MSKTKKVWKLFRERCNILYPTHGWHGQFQDGYLYDTWYKADLNPDYAEGFHAFTTLKAAVEKHNCLPADMRGVILQVEFRKTKLEGIDTIIAKEMKIPRQW